MLKVRSEERTAYLALLPIGLLLLLFVYYPALSTFFLSLTDANPRVQGLEGQAHFIALRNYTQLLASGEFWDSVWRTLLIVLMVLPLELAIGLGAALILNEKFPGRGVVRTIALLPWMLPPLVNGFMWSWILNGDFGALNGLLYQLRLISGYHHWLASPNAQLFWVAVAQVWTRFPFPMVVLLAGLQAIPQEVYEAARVDGGRPHQIFWSVTFPMLLPAFTVALAVEFIVAFQIFDVIWSLTAGGAAGQVINPFTKTVMIMNYEVVFRNFDIGAGSALAYLILLLSMGVGYIFVRTLYERAV
jgi:trehalose/maltose transport system permease protein